MVTYIRHHIHQHRTRLSRHGSSCAHSWPGSSSCSSRIAHQILYNDISDCESLAVSKNQRTVAFEDELQSALLALEGDLTMPPVEQANIQAPASTLPRKELTTEEQIEMLREQQEREQAQLQAQQVQRRALQQRAV